MRTAIFCLETPIGNDSAPLAALAQRPGVVAMVWETAGTRLRVRYDETRLDPEQVQRWLAAAGYPVIVYTLLSRETGPNVQPEPAPDSPSIAWLELDPPPDGPPSRAP